MKKRFLFLSITTLLLHTPVAQAACASYPIEALSHSAPASEKAGTKEATIIETSTSASQTVQAKKRSFFGRLKKIFEAPTGKEQGLAAVLALFFGSLGIHRFYLGRNGSGVLQLFLLMIGFALLSAGGPFTFFANPALPITGAAVAGVLVLAGQSIWVLVDFIRILSGTLKPKSGDYMKPKNS